MRFDAFAEDDEEEVVTFAEEEQEEDDDLTIFAVGVVLCRWSVMIVPITKLLVLKE